MIPTIEDIVRGVKDGTIGFNQACRWLEERVALARNPIYDDERRMFAAMAMQGSLGGTPGSHLVPPNLAKMSVEYADALLKALDSKQREGVEPK